MAFITVAKVASYSGIAEESITTEHLESAEAIVAAFLGAETLALTSHTDTMYPGNNSRYLALPHGPVSTISKVTALAIGSDTVTITDTVYMSGYWMLFYPAGTFTTGSKTVVTYQSGWESSLPTAVEKAAIMTCANLINNPSQRLKSESIGDYSYTMGDGGWSMIEAAIPAPAQIMLSPYRCPDFLY